MTVELSSESSDSLVGTASKVGTVSGTAKGALNPGGGETWNVETSGTVTSGTETSGTETSGTVTSGMETGAGSGTTGPGAPKLTTGAGKSSGVGGTTSGTVVSRTGWIAGACSAFFFSRSTRYSR